jgi:transposase
MGRSIGVDLHRDCFMTAILAENGRCYEREWKLKELGKFVETLASDDKVAVEMTTNVRLFHDAVRPHVERVDVVNTRQFKVVADSVKKTDRNDAVQLARFLEKDMLPTVHLKPKAQADLASLTRTRDTLVKQRTALKNRVNNLFAASGVKLRRERMSSNKALSEIGFEAGERMSAAESLEVEVLLGQIRAINEGVSKLEKMIEAEARQQPGYAEVTSIKGIGVTGAAILLSSIGDVRRFESEGKLAAYFGIVPRVSDSNETERRGRITKRGAKLARTALVQCALVAKKYSSYLAAYHERLKRRKGGGKANIALARKLLGIVYRTLKNGWVFEDFTAFRLKDGTIPVWSRDGARKGAASRRDLSLLAKTRKKRAT